MATTKEENSAQKLSLSQVIEVLDLTDSLKFVCKQIFVKEEKYTKDEWRDKLVKKGILPKVR